MFFSTHAIIGSVVLENACDVIRLINRAQQHFPV